MTALIYVNNICIIRNHTTEKSETKSILYTILSNCCSVGIDKAILIFENIPMLSTTLGYEYVNLPIQVFQCDYLSSQYIQKYTDDAYIVIDSSIYMNSDTIKFLVEEYHRTHRCVLGLRTPVKNEQSLNLVLKTAKKYNENTMQMLCTGKSNAQTPYNNLTDLGQHIITKEVIQNETLTKNVNYAILLNSVIIESSKHGVTAISFTNNEVYNMNLFDNYAKFCIEKLGL